MIRSATALRPLVATIATAGAALLMSLASAAPLPLHGPRRALLRLSWSARPDRIEVCRTLSADELARREEHMRQRVECEGRFASYTLRVEADDRVLEEAVVRGAGLRHDRPIFLLRDFGLAAGAHHIRISFERRERADSAAAFARARETAAPVVADTGIFAGRAQREVAERERRARAAIPQRLVLDTTLLFSSQRVRLVTLAPGGRALHLPGEPSPPR